MSLYCDTCGTRAKLTVIMRIWKTLAGFPNGYTESEEIFCAQHAQERNVPQPCSSCSASTRIIYSSQDRKLQDWYCEACIDDGWPVSDVVISGLALPTEDGMPPVLPLPRDIKK